MKKTLAFLLALTLLLSLSVPAYAAGSTVASGACGMNLKWTLDSSGTLTITGTGAMEGYFYDNPWYYYSERITSVVIKNGVTSIGDSAFEGCSKLTSVTIPSSVKSIGDGAFIRCGSLTSVTLPFSIQSIGNAAFYGCSSLTSVVLPSRVETVGTNAFYNCGKLTSVTVPASVQSIGTDAFLGCTSLTRISVAAANTAYVDQDGVLFNKGQSELLVYPAGKSGAYTIPVGVTTIAENAFNGCKGLTEVTIPSTVQSIGSSAFEGCTALTSVSVPGSVQSIGAYAFYGCSAVKSLTLSNGLEKIENGAFSECSALTSAVIPGTVTKIGARAFAYCGALKSITIPNSVLSVEDGTFSHCTSLTGVVLPNSVDHIGNEAFTYCSALTEVTIPNSVCYVGERAFSYCSKLRNVTIPESVSDIGDWVFSGCVSLTSALLPSSVTSIGDGTFEGCTALASVSIPETVQSIGSFAFSGCAGLAGLTLPEGVKSIGAFAFENCTGLTDISIPQSAKSIGEFAFIGCGSLKSFTVPAGVETIGDGILSGCAKLTALTVAPENTEFTAEDGVLMDAAKTKVIACLPTKAGNYSIPETVKTIGAGAFNGCSKLTGVAFPKSLEAIGDYAFNGCTGLTVVSIPDGVTSIGYSAFNGCSGLTSAVIPASVASIGDYAFAGCGKLANAYYGGVEADWIAKGFGTVFANTVTVHFTSVDELIVANGFCGENLVWMLNSNGTLTVSGTGAMTNYDQAGSTPWNSYTNNITSVVIGDGVTTIGSYAFYSCTKLTGVTLGSGLTEIGYSAFSGCTGLKSITIPENVTEIGNSAFYGCTGLTKVVIPEKVLSIGDYAFNNCANLESVSIPVSVKRIGVGAFSYCGKLADVNYGGSKEEWEAKSFGSLFDKSVKIHFNSSSETYVATGTCGEKLKWTLDGKGTLTVTGTGKMTAYGNSYNVPWAKYQNTIKSVVIGKGAENISTWAFSYCTALTSVTIAESVKSIDLYAFYADTALTDVTIPSSVETIGGSAFYGCTKLAGIELPIGVNTIGDYAFNGCSSLAVVSIPNTVTKIGLGAFSDCGKLADVYYGSTEKEWNKLDLGSSFGKKVKIHFVGSDSDVAVTITTRTVKLGEQVIDSTKDQYPFIVYNEITYLPLTYSACGALGLQSIWTEADGLSVTATGEVRTYTATPNTTPNTGIQTAQIAMGKISLNGRSIDNTKEEYPFLLFRDVTYLPMTWTNMNTYLGCASSYTDAAGLVVTPAENPDSVPVTLCSYPVTLGGQLIDSSNDMYPFFNYNGITYLPLTYSGCGALGLHSVWTPAAGITVTKTGTPISYEATPTSGNTASFKVNRTDTKVTLSGVVLTGTDGYPILTYRDVTYIPMTWTNMHDILGCEQSFNAESGLSIGVAK